jgi:hypothetical protein
MPEFDHGFKIVTRDAGRQLAQVAGVSSTRWELIASEVQTVERFADRAFRARFGRERFVVYFEAYTYWKNAARWSILAKSGLLSEREQLPTKTLVFILHPRGYRPQQGRFRLSVRGKTTQQVFFEEVCLWQKRPQKWWEAVPGLMALYPLCRHNRPPREAITHAAGVIEQVVREPIRRADLLTVLSIFGKLAYPHLDCMALIGRELMSESPLYKEIRQEGAVFIRRHDILQLLRLRLRVKDTAEIEQALNAIDDLESLGRLLEVAALCSQLDEFRQALAEVQTHPRRRRSRGGR